MKTPAEVAEFVLGSLTSGIAYEADRVFLTGAIAARDAEVRKDERERIRKAVETLCDCSHCKRTRLALASGAGSQGKGDDRG